MTGLHERIARFLALHISQLLIRIHSLCSTAVFGTHGLFCAVGEVLGGA